MEVFAVIVLGIVYLVAIGLFFWFAFLPLQMMLALAAFGAVGIQLGRAFGDVFDIDWSKGTWFRLVGILYATVGFSLELAGFVFQRLHDAGAGNYVRLGEGILNWIAANAPLIRLLPDHRLAEFLAYSPNGLGLADTPLAFFAFLGILGTIEYVVLIPVVAAGRTFSPRHAPPSSASQPAYRSYFFRRVFLDLRDVIRASWERMNELFTVTVVAGSACFGEAAALTWPLGVVVFVGSVFPAIIATAAGVLMLTVQIAVSGLAIVVNLILTGLLLVVESFGMLARGIHMVCPNSRCYKRVRLPVYHCPECRRVHSRLVPGSFGLARRHCLCWKTLPTLFLFGRGRLPAFCPHCESPLSKEIGATQNVHIPIVGGPAVGKSSFLIASYVAVSEYLEGEGGRIGLAESAARREFESFVDSYKMGIPVNKTAEEPPDAVLMKVHKRFDLDFTDSLLYIYDPGGEILEDEDPLRLQSYFKDADGVLLLVDPFSFRPIAERYGGRLALISGALSASRADPEQVAARFVNAIQAFKHADKRTRLSIPLSVVLTKWDALDLSSEISLDLPAHAASDKVRAWLSSTASAGNLVRTLETYFKQVRYFVSSPLGRMPGSTRSSFAPRGVIEPILWATHRTDVF
ncbi:hypothetical protein ACFL5T_01765 [Gemmatimonadota bacterium]